MIPAALVVAFAGLVVLLSLVGWSLLTDDEHLTDLDADDEDRAHGGGW